MIDVTEQSFERDVLQASHNIPVLVEIWAPSSAPSRALAATLERIELDMAGVFTLVRIDAGENALLLARMGVKALPFALLFKEGEPVDGFVGTPRESTVRGFLSRHVSRPPGETLADHLKEAVSERRWGDVMATSRALLAINPADREVRAGYVDALVRLRRIEEAERAFEPLARAPGTDGGVDALRTLLGAGRALFSIDSEAEARAALATAIARAARDEGSLADMLDARHSLSLWLLVAGRYAEAMDEALTILEVDRTYGDGAARSTMLAAFELDADKARVTEYRHRLAAALFR
jgi:putative thioredoxin